FFAIAIAQFIAKVSGKVFLRLPGGAKRNAVEVLSQPFEMKAALVTQFQRELLAEGKPVDQSDDRKTVSCVNAVINLISSSHGSEPVQLRFNAKSHLAASR